MPQHVNILNSEASLQGSSMTNKTRTAVAHLLGTGALLGAYFPLGKFAGQAGIPPVAWAWIIALGPSTPGQCESRHTANPTTSRAS